MTQAARFLLLIVLAVSLPFHSAYAVSMSQCVALQQPSEQVNPGASHADHGSPDGHDHTRHADGSAQHGDDGTPVGSHCGSCSACGTSASITGRVLRDILSGDYAALQSSPERRLVGVASARLYRPPLALAY